MKKLLKEILTSKIFFIWIIISILSQVYFFTNYEKDIVNSRPENNYYLVLSYETKEELLENKNEVIEQMNKLDISSKDYELNYSILLETLKIYTELERSDVNYSDVLENMTNDNYDDRTTYNIRIEGMLMVEALITIIILIYIVFTREFDCGVYSIIYSDDRKPILIKKIAVIFIGVLIYYFLSFLISYIISLNYDTEYKYMLMLDKNKAHFIKSNFYLFKYCFLLNLYRIIFISILFTGLAIFNRKTIRFILCIFVVLIIIIVMSSTTLLLTILGFIDDLVVANMTKLSFDLAKLFIVIPISLLVYSIFHFDKVDL